MCIFNSGKKAEICLVFLIQIKVLMLECPDLNIAKLFAYLPYLRKYCGTLKKIPTYLLKLPTFLPKSPLFKLSKKSIRTEMFWPKRHLKHLPLIIQNSAVVFAQIRYVKKNLNNFCQSDFHINVHHNSLCKIQYQISSEKSAMYIEQNWFQKLQTSVP